jgi:hypothetical protein
VLRQARQRHRARCSLSHLPVRSSRRHLADLGASNGQARQAAQVRQPRAIQPVQTSILVPVNGQDGTTVALAEARRISAPRIASLPRLHTKTAQRRAADRGEMISFVSQRENQCDRAGRKLPGMHPICDRAPLLLQGSVVFRRPYLRSKYFFVLSQTNDVVL